MLLVNVKFTMTISRKLCIRWFTGFFSSFEFFKVSPYKIFSWWMVTFEGQKALNNSKFFWVASRQCYLSNLDILNIGSFPRKKTNLCGSSVLLYWVLINFEFFKKMPSVGRDRNFIFLWDIFDSFLKQHIKKGKTFANFCTFYTHSACKSH